MVLTLLILLGVLIIAIGVMYNQLISVKNARKQSLSDIDAQAKLRFDLIPNLVEAVKGYSTHESTTLENVTKARSAIMTASSPSAKMEAENMLSGALKSLFAVAESYPDLKANQNFMHLQQELSDVEDKLAAARRFLNHATKEYNTLVESFPHILVARMFGFHSEEFFEVGAENERENISVKL